MKSLPAFLVGILMYFTGLTQTSNDIDSLLKTSANEVDSAKYATLMKVGNMYSRKGQPDSAMHYFSLVLDYAKQKGSQRQLCVAYLSVAGAHIRKAAFEKALENLFTGLKIAEQNRLTKYIAQASMDIGFIYRDQNKIKESVRYLQRAVDAAKQENDTIQLTGAYTELGQSLGIDGDTAKALTYLYTSANMMDKFVLDNAAALGGRREFITNRQLSNLYGIVNLDMDSAALLKTLDRILPLEKTIAVMGNGFQQLKINMLKANVYQRIGRYKEALEAGEYSIRLMKETGQVEYGPIRDLYGLVAQSAGSLGEYKKAYENLELFRQFNDTLFNRGKLEAINSVEAKYETEKKELRIAELNKEKKRDRLLLVALIAGLLIVAGLLVFAVRSARLQKKLHAKEKEAQRLELEQRMFELEQTALRAQMNPHFIFNSLNSVQRFAITNDAAGIHHYLNTFASLIRQTLENSGKQSITLKDELKYLDTYIRLEQLRSHNQFSYTIHVDEGVDTEAYSLPGMIIQPFVENSIRHGFPPAGEGEGLLEINVAVNDRLTIAVEDNGAGIGHTKGNTFSDHIPMGKSITEKRIALYNSAHEEKMELEIADKQQKGEATRGTRVVLRFPIKDNV